MTTLTRNDRRREITRGKLLAGAREVIAAKGVEVATIRDITEAADVASGSFYTYFDSKEAIVVAAVEDIFLGFAELIEESNAAIEDPAEKVAVALSFLMRMVVADPLQAQFLIRAELFNESIGTESRKRSIRDLSDGMKRGVFKITNAVTASHLISGMYIGYLRGRLFGQIEEKQEANTILMLLRSLGVPEEQAETLSQRYGANF